MIEAHFRMHGFGTEFVLSFKDFKAAKEFFHDQYDNIVEGSFNAWCENTKQGIWFESVPIAS